MDALRSRCQIFNLVPPLDKVTARVVHILRSENIIVPDEEKSKLLELIRTGYPDMRRIINDVQKYSHTGTLLIKCSNTKNLAEKIIQKLIKKTNLIEIRKFVIESEQNFSSDYIQLLREMFEAVYTNSQISEQKNTWLLTISEAMYKDAIVLDKEINWFSCCIKLNDHNIS